MEQEEVKSHLPHIIFQIRFNKLQKQLFFYVRPLFLVGGRVLRCAGSADFRKPQEDRVPLRARDVPHAAREEVHRRYS